MNEINERRRRQRIAVDHVRPADFRLQCDGTPAEVKDVSLDGFAMRAGTAPDASHGFAFRLEHRELPGAVIGRAQVVNYSRGATAQSGVAGCRILAMDKEGRETLAAWLSAHVTKMAGMPLSRDEAREIVAGPSLV